MLLAVAATGCRDAPDPAPLAPAAAPPIVVVRGIDGGAALAALPGGELLVADIRGVRAVRPDGETGPAADAPIADGDVDAIAVDPAFVRSRLLHVRRGRAVDRILLADGRGRVVRTMLLPSVARIPGGLALGPDGRLYAGIGARGPLAALMARTARNPRGAVVRLEADGDVPPDNPFGPANPVFAFGLGAPVDLAFDPVDGALYAVDRGFGGGRVVRLEPGADAGWPLVRGGLDGPLERLAARALGGAFRAPVWAPDGRGAPTSVLVLRGHAFAPELDGRLLVGFSDGRIVQLGLDPTRSRAIAVGTFAVGVEGGVSDLVLGADGRVYALSPSRLYRIDPAGLGPPPPTRPERADTVSPPPRPWER